MKNEEDVARMNSQCDPDTSRTATTVAPTTHTPTPWYWTGDGRIIEGEGYIVADPDGGIINDEDAEFIVRACNSHGDLLTALKALMNDIDTGLLVRDITRDGEPGWAIHMLQFVQRLQAAQIAIAKAERP